MRTRAFAEDYAPSVVDRFGVWLSARQIRRWVPSFAGKRVGDFGCGFHATFARGIVDGAAHLTLVDLSIEEALKRHPKITAIEAPLTTACADVPDASLD